MAYRTCQRLEEVFSFRQTLQNDKALHFQCNKRQPHYKVKKIIMTTQEKNKALISNLIKEANIGNTNIFWEAVSPKCRILDNFGKVYTKEAYIQFMDNYDKAVPDYQMNIQDMIAEGDKVAVRYNETGTIKKTILSMEGTGKSYSIPGIEIYRFADGKITEIWMARDTLGMGIQAEAIPNVSPAI
jgi:steroid delta-isomerase-like uncharacterized protein